MHPRIARTCRTRTRRKCPVTSPRRGISLAQKAGRWVRGFSRTGDLFSSIILARQSYSHIKSTAAWEAILVKLLEAGWKVTASGLSIQSRVAE
jgi:hypothetical protein